MIMGQLLPQHPLTFVILCFVRVRHKHGIAFWTFVSMEDLKMTLPVGPEALCEIASLVTTKFFVRPPRGLNVGRDATRQCGNAWYPAWFQKSCTEVYPWMIEHLRCSYDLYIHLVLTASVSFAHTSGAKTLGHSCDYD